MKRGEKEEGCRKVEEKIQNRGTGRDRWRDGRETRQRRRRDEEEIEEEKRRDK